MFDDLTRVCASRAEYWSVRGKAVLAGVGCYNEPEFEGDGLSCGVTGSLVSWLNLNVTVEGCCLVVINGNELWSRDPADTPTDFPQVKVYAAEKIIDDPEERAWLHSMTGAHVLDLESGMLAKIKKLRRIIRVVSDSPLTPLKMAAYLLHPNGRTDMRALLWAMRLDPRGTTPELWQLWKAIRTFKGLGL